MDFGKLPEPTPDPILGLGAEIAKDPRNPKVNLVVGVYCNEHGSAAERLPSVDLAMKQHLGTPNYSPIAGDVQFREQAGQLLFGRELFGTLSERTAQAQTAGGTGALCLAAQLLKKTNPQSSVFISNPTWPNHRGIFQQAGFEDVQMYPYYDTKTSTVDALAMKEALQRMPRESIVILHACCHNPTGIDMPSTDWDNIINIIRENGLIPVLDSAYQGFGNGVEEDAEIIRKFSVADMPVLVAQSFSKMFHIYNSRTGALHVLCNDADEKRKVQGAMEGITRSTISNPPAEGSRIITTILSNVELTDKWRGELEGMRARIQNMRQQLVTGLGDNFSHLAGQKGMFSYTGLTPAEVEALKRDYAIYMLTSGRMSIPGLNPGNIQYVNDSIQAVLKETRGS